MAGQQGQACVTMPPGAQKKAPVQHQQDALENRGHRVYLAEVAPSGTNFRLRESAKSRQRLRYLQSGIATFPCPEHLLQLPPATFAMSRATSRRGTWLLICVVQRRGH